MADKTPQTTTPTKVKAPVTTPQRTNKATVHVRIEGDPPMFVATTPHVPDLRGEAVTEHQAVNGLMDAIRSHRRRYETKGDPVPWNSEAVPKPDKDTVARQISGLWPEKTSNPK